MSGRPRIRSVKPEIWQDENIGDLCHGARLLLIGLITMADDEGRLRALPTLILGHVFPYDEVTPAKLRRWLGQIEAVGLIVRYEDGGKPYIAFRHWKRHQKVNRPNASVLPEPPDPQVVTDNSVNPQGADTEESGSSHGRRTPPRAGAGSDPDPDPLPVPDVEVPTNLQGVVANLERVTFQRSLPTLNLQAVVKAASDFHDRDLDLESDKFAHYFTDGVGENRRMRDVVATWRNWLSSAPTAGKARGGSPRSTADADIRKLQTEKERLQREEAVA